MTPVTITHLELLTADALRPKSRPSDDAAIAPVRRPCPELNRFFYTAIGGDWHWHERIPWTYADWTAYLNRPELSTWLVTVESVPAGYFELELQAGPSVEIVYFGLLPQYVGGGLGGWALTEAVRTAWGLGAKRVWVHTCDLDHPGALSNYLARGFTPFKTEVRYEDLPPVPPGPWPGARPLQPGPDRA